jgi:hypothetical protein
MKNKINVAELLKDCPSGMELDCTMYDDIRFYEITDDPIFPIRIKRIDGATITLTKYGGYADIGPSAKCVIFPKGKTTWKGFHRPFKEGDIVFVNDEYSDATFTYVAILKRIENNDSVFVHCFYNYDDDVFSTHEYLCDGYNTRFATEEEKQRLFDAIKANGYKWNEETKTLEKLENMDKANKAVFDANTQCCDIMNHLIKEESMEEIIKIDIPKGYEFAGVDDDKQQVVFEKVKSKYPKTYRECAEIVGFNIEEEPTIFGYKEELLDRFQKLLICRDAYWKIAGEQMDLGRPWNQDYDDRCFIIANNNGNIHTYEYHGTNNVILAFPTAEMRDAFLENFGYLIELCKELL